MKNEKNEKKELDRELIKKYIRKYYSALMRRTRCVIMTNEERFLVEKASLKVNSRYGRMEDKDGRKPVS